MPNKMDKELKRKFGAYLKVAILNAKKEYLIELNKIIKTETSLDEVDSIKDRAAERMLENVCIDYKIKDGEEFHARDILNSIDDPTLYSAISALNTLQIEILVLRCVGKKTFREIGKLVGTGEAREADIGIAGGKGEAVLFIHGQPIKKLTGDNILDQFMEEIYKI